MYTMRNELAAPGEKISLYDGLFGSYHLLQKHLVADLAEAGLTGGQPKILFCVARHPGCTQKELAAACLVEQATVTVLLARLEAHGLIERRAAQGDRRAWHVYLTDAGQQALQKILAELQRLEELFFSGISAGERAVFLRILQQARGNLLQSYITGRAD